MSGLALARPQPRAWLRAPAVRRRRPPGPALGSVPALTAAAAAAAALALLPVASLLRTAASGGSDAFRQLAATVLPDALLQTLTLLAGVALGAGAIGAGTAWLVTAYRFPGSRALAWLLPLPLAAPAYVAAFIYVELLDSAGPVQVALRSAFGWSSRAEHWFPEIRSMAGCVLVFSLVLYPYVFVPVRAAFLARGRAAVDAARTLGGGGWAVFSRVALPLARPALAAGVALALLETLNDIGATEFLGVRTLTLSAYAAWLNRGDLPAAAQLASVALVGVLLMLGLERRARPGRVRAEAGDAVRPTEPVRLRGRRAALAALACGAPVAFGLLVPLAFLAGEALEAGALPSALAGPALVSVGLAAAATALVLAAAVPVALSTRWPPAGGAGALPWLAGLGYALPGTLLVIGLLPPLVGLDRALGAALGPFGAGGLFLTGSVGGLLVAYLIRFLRVAAAPLAAHLVRGGDALESAARTLGARPSAVVGRLQLPLLRPALAGAALLVFVDCLKELPATLLLRPLNVETLATTVYGAAARGTFEEGAGAALLIVLACLVPVALLTRAAIRPAGR